MPESPLKWKQPVSFKVTIPNNLEKHSKSREDQGEQKKCPKNHGFKVIHSSEELNSELQKFDLRFKIKNSLNLEEVLDNSGNVLSSLKNSSYGRVIYNRNKALSEEELPSRQHMIPQRCYSKLVERVCSPENDRKVYKSAEKSFDDRSDKFTIQDIHNEHLNSSITMIQSIEFLNDSLSLLHMEEENRKATADFVETEKRKHTEHFRRSAQLSHDSYEEWSEKSRSKLQQQVKLLKDRKSKRESSIELEYKKQQEYFQKKFEEDKALLKKKEQSEKEKARQEAAENQRQISSSWNNITIYEATTLEILAAARKCVPDPKVDGEIESLIVSLDKFSSQIVVLKASANVLYEGGALEISEAIKTEQEMFLVYNNVRITVDRLNDAIKRVNEEQAAVIAQALKEEQEAQARREKAKLIEQEKAEKERVKEEKEKQIQQENEKANKAESDKLVQKQTSVDRQSSSDSGSVPGRRRSRLLSSEAIVNVNIISTTAFSEYQRLSKLLRDTEQTVHKFVSDKDKEISKMRSALKLVTVTPINSISASSNEHMANKVKELVNILHGKETVRANKRINPGLNKLTLTYCFNIAASNFVDQACEQVAFSDNLVPAFSIAVVITGIWQNHSAFGDLFLAHLHKRCPYSIPANWNKKDGESNSDYLKRLGYTQDGDKLEESDKFLLKMAGCIKLYAAVIQSPPSFQDQPHPHGLASGWCWLSRILNLEPVPDVTATVIGAFLQVAGSALYLKYGSQFLKLMEFLYSIYLPKLEAVTLESNLGPITRLKLYLEKVKDNKTIPSPDGRIDVSVCK